MNMRRPLLLAAILPCLLLLPSRSHALWPSNGAPIGTQSNNQNLPRAISDGAGGAIITWEDNRSSSYVIYAQRVDAMGDPQWTPDGVLVSSPGSVNNAPQLIPDGAGGAIITWYRNGDILAQRMNSNGSPQWTVGGVFVSIATGAQQIPTIASDNAGGAIITWQDNRTITDYDIYAQRINGSGVTQWTSDGVGVCTLGGASNSQTSPQITADGSGGAVIAWTDTRNGSLDIYVQKVNASGVMQWAANGVAIVQTVDIQTDPSLCSDGLGGAIVAWEDNRSLSWDTYARRINSAGTPQWTANGVVLSAQANFQLNPVLIADGVGGAIVAWDDGRTGGIPDIYVQRLNSAGTALWTANGVALATTGNGSEPEIVTDGLGGAIVAWQDTRSGNSDVYARRINSSGVAQWTANGVALSTAAGAQRTVAIASDGVGGAIVAFEDLRGNGVNTDVYAQRIERNGYWGYPAPEMAGVIDIPGDQGGKVNLSWGASRLDLWPDELLQTYTVWRAIDASAALVAINAGAARVRDGLDPMPSSGRDVVRVQVINSVTYYWKLMNTLGAYHLTGYSDVVPTLFDSTAASPDFHHFQVIAHAAVGQWISAVADGRSVDNVAPAPPLQLSAQRVGADVHLVWNQNHDPDLENYKVYRKSSAGVTPILPNFLSSAEDTILVDASAPATSLYYIVTAVDAHANQSAPSNEAAVSPVTGVGDTPQTYVLSLSSYPTPFNPRTTVKYTGPSRGHVSVRVFDTHGALVATLFNGERNAGAYSIDWDGRTTDAAGAASGVYFARIEHNGATRTKKMVLLK